MSLKQRGHAMRTFDFAPFYRSTVGFDRLFSMLDQVGGVESAAAPGYPPYNIRRSGENAYNISVAVAGFAGADLSIEVKENTLTIRGNKQSSGEEESDLIYQGIAERNFERNFQLADHVQIKGASLENGLLQVDLLRVVPEAMKPRAIPITTAKKVVLEGKARRRSPRESLTIEVWGRPGNRGAFLGVAGCGWDAPVFRHPCARRHDAESRS